MKHRLVQQKAFTLLEVVVSLGLLIMVFGGVTSLALLSSEAERSARNNSVAAYLAKEAENLVRYKRDLNYIMLVSPFNEIAIETDNTNYSFVVDYNLVITSTENPDVKEAMVIKTDNGLYTTSSGTDTIFRRLVTTTYHAAAGPLPARIDVKVEVYWKQDSKKNTYTLTSELTDWRGAGGGGPTDCTGANTEGDACGGGIVIDSAQHIVVVPGGCQDTSGNGCGGGTDSYTAQWDSDGDLNSTSATDAHDGRNNATTLDIANHPEYVAAAFCDSLSYGGFTDWYLPAQNELDAITNAATHVWITDAAACGYYWSSTEQDSSSAYNVIVYDGGAFCGFPPASTKSDTFLTRCVRRYN